MFLSGHHWWIPGQFRVVATLPDNGGLHTGPFTEPHEHAKPPVSKRSHQRDRLDIPCRQPAAYAIGRNSDINPVRSNVTCNGPTQFMGVLPIRPGGA